MASKESLDLLEKIYADVHHTHLKTIQQKMIAQKAWLSQKQAESDFFFERLKQLLEAVIQWNFFSEQLLLAAKHSGFTNLEEALNQAKNTAGQSPLQFAFLQQHFPLAKWMIDNGATVNSEDRAAFEIALDSKAARDYGFIRPTKETPFHPVKNFGLVLGIQMTSRDGTYSQFAHIAPTYQLMTDAVADYARMNPERSHFQAIANAFTFSNKAAAYSYSTSQRNPEAGKELAARIQQGQITTIPIGCKGHVMGLSIVPDGIGANSGHLVFTNRGLGANPSAQGTQIYRIDDLSKISPEFINSMMDGLNNGSSHSDIMRQVKQVTGGKNPVHMIKQKGQKHDNCTVANTRANIEGILLCQRANAKQGFARLDANDLNEVKAEYKHFTATMRANKINELVAALKKQPKDSDLRNLAKEYLRQHPKAAPELRASLEKALSATPQQEDTLKSSSTFRAS